MKYYRYFSLKMRLIPDGEVTCSKCSKSDEKQYLDFRLFYQMSESRLDCMIIGRMQYTTHVVRNETFQIF